MIVKVETLDGDIKEIDVKDRKPSSRYQLTERQKKIFYEIVNNPIEKQYDQGMIERLKLKQKSLTEEEKIY